MASCLASRWLSVADWVPHYSVFGFVSTIFSAALGRCVSFFNQEEKSNDKGFGDRWPSSLVSNALASACKLSVICIEAGRWGLRLHGVFFSLPSTQPPTPANQWHLASSTGCYINHYFISLTCFLIYWVPKFCFLRWQWERERFVWQEVAQPLGSPVPSGCCWTKHIMYLTATQAAMMFVYRRVPYGHGATYSLISAHNQSNLLSLSVLSLC